jgi:hypothetical protein
MVVTATEGRYGPGPFPVQVRLTGGEVAEGRSAA